MDRYNITTVAHNCQTYTWNHYDVKGEILWKELEEIRCELSFPSTSSSLPHTDGL
jgi:hypothetical protein